LAASPPNISFLLTNQLTIRQIKMKMADYEEDNNWEEFKTKFNHDMKELGNAFSDLTVNNVN